MYHVALGLLGFEMGGRDVDRCEHVFRRRLSEGVSSSYDTDTLWKGSECNCISGRSGVTENLSSMGPALLAR